MGLVKGFTDIIAPQNLATNGSFRINQRGLFTDYNAYDNKLDSAKVKVGDYITDAWFVEEMYVDSVYAVNFNIAQHSYASLGLRGSGKKGQIITLTSKDNSALGQSNSYQVLTSAVGVGIPSISIPLQVDAVPRRHGNHSVDYVNYVKGSNIFSNAVRVHTSTAYPIFTSGAMIVVTLLADGEFFLSLTDFREFAGAYINPPKLMPAHYADDLLRCKRYYQKGECFNSVVFAKVSDTMAQTSGYFNFPVEMAGTPSVAIQDSIIYSALTGSGGNSVGPFTSNMDNIHNISSKGCRVQVGLHDVTNAPLLFDNGGTYGYSWTATV